MVKKQKCTYTLYSGSGVFEKNLVGSDMSMTYILGVLEHIFADMENDQTKTLTILATKEDVYEQCDEEETKEIDLCWASTEASEIGEGSDDEEFEGEGTEEADDAQETEGD